MKSNTINMSSKKTIMLSVICIVFSLLFSACSSNMSITKRHYNNGYYIAHSKSIKTPVETPTQKKKIREEITTPVYASVIQKSEHIADAYSATKNSEEISVSVVEKSEVIKRKSISQKNTNQLFNYKSISVKKPVLQINNAQKNTTTSNGEALSLLWIVILVILILWLFGFIAGGLGLGGLINILLLIALILFILWILRVL